MTHLINDPQEFAGEALAGFAAAHPDTVVLVPGSGVVRADVGPEPRVTVVMGGGSGHYPAFAGWVGDGVGDGAVCGNVFSSPSATQIVQVTRAAASGADVLFVPINYAGDMLHFSEARERLASDGIDARIVAVTDDIASTVTHADARRGIAGSFIVLKIVGAAARRGDTLDAVESIARRAVAATRTLGVAFTGCTLPGSAAPSVTIDAGRMTIGLGIHGEPGLEEREIATADETADILVDALFAERAPEPGRNVAVLVNGLGATTPDELYIVFARVARRLEAEGMTIVSPVVDELVTSLDMAGLSLSLTYLDDELADLWRAPAHTVAFSRGPVAAAGATSPSRRRPPVDAPAASAPIDYPPASDGSRRLARIVHGALTEIADELDVRADELARLDAIAGDGDHGACMQRGSAAARKAADQAIAVGAGAGSTLEAAGEAWSNVGGGTSGALWGAGLAAVGRRVGNDESDLTLLDAVSTFATTVIDRGGATVGDKTMVDAIVPFSDRLAAEIDAGRSSGDAWASASRAAADAAAGTAAFASRLGRSRTHGDASVGTPDPGAVSFGLVVERVATTLGAQS